MTEGVGGLTADGRLEGETGDGTEEMNDGVRSPCDGRL